MGASGNYDRLPFPPHLILSMFVFFMPNLLGDSENYVMVNPMQTPPAILRWKQIFCVACLSITFGTHVATITISVPQCFDKDPSLCLDM